MSNRSSHFANRFQTMSSAMRAAPLRVLFLAVAVVGLMTVAELPSASPVHAQEQAVTATRAATGESPPARPTDLQASAEPDSVSLTWTASTDQTVTHYAVLLRDRDDDDAGVFHVIDSNAGSATSYTDRSVSPGDSYVYRVKAVSPTGVSQWSSYARADILADPEDLAPSGLSAKAVFDGGVSAGVELSWDAPAVDAASVTGYEVLRAVGDGDLATLAADTGSADTTYADDTATEAGERYAYRVKALRGQEASQPSDRAEAIIPKVTALPSEPRIAEEQNEALWSETLTAGDLGSGTYGCSNGLSGKECSSLLNDDDFTYNGTMYQITFLFTYSTGFLDIHFKDALGEDADSFVLNADGDMFAFQDGTTATPSSRAWFRSGYSWSDGESVSLSITVSSADATPAVSSVDVTSEPGDDDTYAIGDTVQVTGVPRIQLRVGGGEDEHLKWADYFTGTGAAVVHFTYVVLAGDFDDNGFYIAADELELNGGTIQSSGGTDANLDYPDQGAQSGHNVDGVRPTPEFAATSLDGNSIFVIFSESLSATTAAASAFTLSVDTGTAPAISTATASGDTVTLGLGSALTSGQVVTVAYVDASQGDDADTFTQTVTNNVAIVVSANWGLIPSGLAAGAEFRLIFVSLSTRNAASTDIADYNTFVQAAAAAGHADIQQYSSRFRVVGSTADVDARDNTATTYTSADKGVAIYWLGGNKVVDDYEDFYDGDWDDEANAKDESGNNRSTSGSSNYPWTGSNDDGTEAFNATNASRALGASLVQVGRPSSGTGDGPLSGAATGNSNARPLYGLSAVFRVSFLEVVTNTAPAFTTVADFSTNEHQRFSFQVTAMDPDDGDEVTYAITGGADQGLFVSNATTGLLAFPTLYDHENPADADGDNVYLVTVTASGGTGARALSTDQAITVTVTDVDEPPSAPAAPTVSAVSGSSDSLSVTWTAPDNTGKPDIASYDLQYRKGTTGNFADGPQDVTGLTDTITGLDADSLYQVQVRATNDEGDGAWSSAGSGATNALTGCGTLPTDRLWSACLTVGEPSGGGKRYQGSDGSLSPATFDVGTTTYTVTQLTDNDNIGGVTGIKMTLQPALAAADAVGLTLHLGDDTSLSFADATASVTTLASQFRWTLAAALGWSTGDAMVVGITQEEQANTAPAFTTGADFSTNENQAVAFQVTAVDDDSGDEVSYAITGGADQSRFVIDATSGQVIGPIPDYENPADADSNNVYLVTVTATGGTGARALTTEQAITVTVLDVIEPPRKPSAPTVDAVDGTTDSLSVSWTAPDNTGRPAIDSYDLQYRKGTTGNWIDGPQDETGTTATISGLDADSLYQVQVRATNDEGDGAWSSPGSGTTNAPAEELAETTVPADWGLIPSGLGAGDRFRLIFISSTTRDGSSSDIADYNTFVQNAAANGHTDIQSHSSTFRVVGSTADVDARDNTATTYTADDKGVAVYWLGGAKVADEYEGFYDGEWDDEANAKDESGDDRSTTFSSEYPITGSDHDGTERIGGGNASRAFGATLVLQGRPNSNAVGFGPLSSNSITSNSNARPLYGLSGVFRVAGTAVTSTDATLNALSLSGITLSPTFAADTLTYTGSVDNDVTSTTVTATANDDGATVAIVPADADDTADGHQVTLAVGDTAVSVTVAAEDGTTTQTYAVTVTRAEALAVTASANPTTVNGGGTVMLTSTVTGAVGTVTYGWSGGGTFSSTSIPNPVWTADASFSDVTFALEVVVVAGGTLARADVRITVRGNQAPEVSLDSTATHVDGGDEVSLTASATDPEGDVLTYAWTSSAGGSFDDAGALDTTWTAPDATRQEQPVTLTLTVTDDGAGTRSTTRTRMLTVRANEAPAGSVSAQPETVLGGKEVQLTASVADPENGALTYAWNSSGGGAFANASAANTRWTAPAAATADQTVTLTLTVTDTVGDTDFSTDVTVRANQPPTVVLGSIPTEVRGGQTLSLVVTFFTDPEGDTLTFAWTNDGGGTFQDAGALHARWIAPDATDADQTVMLTLTATDDGAGARSASATVTVTVLAQSQFVVTITADPKTVNGGGTVMLSSTVTGAVGTVTYAWSGGGTFSSTSIPDPVWTAPPATSGAHFVNFSLLAIDDVTNAIDNVRITVRGNQAPEVSASAAPASVAGGGAVTLDGTSTDPEGDTLTYAWTSDGGGSFADASALDTTWTAPDATDAAQTIMLTLMATDDGAGTRSASHTVTVTVEAQDNTAPAFTTTADFSTNENEAIAFTVTATDDDDGDEVSYAVTGGADQALFQIDAASGALTSAAAPDHEDPADAGRDNTYLVTVTATGGTGARALTTDQAITVTVTDVDEPPSAPVTPTVSAVSGSSDSLLVEWAAPDNSGKPDIESYDLQYRKGTTGDYTDGPQDETVASATIDGLDADSAYQVRVRATNDEGDSGWSSAGSGTTNAQTPPTGVDFIVSPDPGTYAIDRTLSVTVVFSAAVTVSGTPQLALDIGGEPRQANYASGSGTQEVLFSYTVVEDDEDTDGTLVPANGLTLNGGTITAGGIAASLTNLSYANPDVLVDGVRPIPEFAATSVDGNSIIIIFSESLSATTAPASAFTLSVDTGTAPTVSTATASGDKVTLGLASALTSDQVVTVVYVDATLGDDALAVQDAAGNDAANFTTGSGDVPAVANAVGTGCSLVAGCYVVSADWGLIPSGLGAGAEFRLVFISSGTRNAAASDIADYNTFVQTAAAAGHADIQDYSSTFRVVGSTADVDARDNTATTYTNDDKGVAIYWLGGAKVADEYEDFYDGDWDDEANAKDESGSDRSTSLDTDKPLTGSDHDGTEAISGSSSRALGASSVQTGSPNSSASGYGPLGSNFATVNSTARPFYGLSPVFRVAGQVVTNTAPAFTTGADFSTNENQFGLFQVTAMDADAGDDVTYAITGGADLAQFQINASGRLDFGSRDHENPADADSNNVYLVTVTATGGTGARALTTDQAITMTVTDVDEPPRKPSAPTVDAVDGTTDSLSVSWTAPSSTDRPAIASYDLQYRKGSAGIFADGPQDVTGLTTTIDRLDAGAEYQVQVRATNDEGDSFWSQSGSGTTNEPTDPTSSDNLTATAHTGKIRLEWTGTADAYEFRRKEDGGAWSAWTAAETRGWFVLRNATTLDDYDVLAQTKYTYQVRGAGAAANLGEASATLGAPITLRLGDTEYSVDEGAGELFFTVLAETPAGLDRYDRDIRPSFTSTGVVGPLPEGPLVKTQEDYELLIESLRIEPGDFVLVNGMYVASRLRSIGIVDDTLVEEDETFELRLLLAGGVSRFFTLGAGDGRAEVTIVDNDTGSAPTSAPATFPPLTGFELVDATAHLDAGAVEDGATLTGIDPAKLYGFRANVTPGADLKSVKLELSGPGPDDRVARTENGEPYALYGDSDGHEHGAALAAGSYTLTATAHSEKDGGGSELGTLSVEFTVAGEPLTARFEGLPEGIHGGAGETFSLRLSFSEAVSTTPEALRDHALEVTNATVAVSRVDERSDLWEVRLTPESDAMVTVSLLPAADCDATGAVCTEDGRMLSFGVARVIPGPPTNSPATGAPSISGAARVGQTLTADTSGIADDDGLENVTFSYQWMADDANIQGATGSSYTLTEDYEGKTIKVIVSFTDDANNEESLPSAATDSVVALPGKPQDLEGAATAQEIELTWKAPTGDAVVEYVVYRGILQNGSMNGQALSKYATVEATGAAMTYTDDNVEEGVEYRYRVAAVNSAGEGKKSNWLDITAEEPSP